MGKISIQDLRNITSMEFEVPTTGVHLLTGCNGCGKTSLLIALNRICNNTAFSGFKLGRKVGMDKFSTTKITYSDGTNSIWYSRTNRGWEPHPRGSKPNTLFSFADSYFITTSGFRFFEPNTDQFYKRGGRVVYTDAPQEIKDGLNIVFDTQKFNDLKYVTIRGMHGRQKKLHRTNIMYVIKSGANVYSEMNFSLGERLVLNTLDFAQGIPNNVLLLIDEIELALHPVAQIRFYNYIKNITAAHSLSCIISTHSASLIKIAQSRLYLENHNGSVDVIKNCEPAYILKDLTITPDNRPDYLFFVEDIMAWRYLNAILRKYQQTEDKNKFIKISYVGGYEQVVQLAESFYTTPPFAQRMIQSFPDADVRQSWDELIAKPNKTHAENRKLDLLNRNSHNISLLDITPELGIWNWLVADASTFEHSFTGVFGAQLFSMQNLVNQVVVEEAHYAPGKPREHAKGCFKNLVEKIQLQVPGTSGEVILDLLFKSYVHEKMQDMAYFNSWKQVFKSIFNRH